MHHGVVGQELWWLKSTKILLPPLLKAFDVSPLEHWWAPWTCWKCQWNWYWLTNSKWNVCLPCFFSEIATGIRDLDFTQRAVSRMLFAIESSYCLFWTILHKYVPYRSIRCCCVVLNARAWNLWSTSVYRKMSLLPYFWVLVQWFLQYSLTKSKKLKLSRDISQELLDQ